LSASDGSEVGKDWAPGRPMVWPPMTPPAPLCDFEAMVGSK
jgi:hypothetical protein